MIQEEILYKKSKTGTTVFYFAPGITPELVPFLDEPAYITFDTFNAPNAFYNYASGTTELWKLMDVNGYNINVQLSSVTTNYLTGYSHCEVFNKILSTAERNIIQERFNNNVTSTITGQTQVPVNYPTYVFFTEHEVDDMFANIKLSRTYETLDTLKIYNKPINSIPQQEAKTGVLFGKLQAIQILKDEVGNNIKIPLRNVPIGIFNPTEEFNAPMSLDANGDRFFMNILESANPNQYFNAESFTADTKLLKSQTQFLTVPEKFKYITTTNENGEFVIYNAPVGAQTLVLEVDLFKQGLTKDEIILNNFPFPTNDDSNIGEFPCYYYHQLPLDIVPTWGNNQSGYTEVNVNINLDLRKWATYIFPPASFGNEKLETTVAKNVANTFKVQVRDMTNKKFAPKSLEIVQIPNDLDRADGSKYLWFNEILSQRQQIEFFKYGCHVLKLPANLYDPNGYKTDTNGVPNSSRGVWLAAYQFNSFVNIDRCKRATGGVRVGDDETTLNHFDLNNYAGAPAGAPINSGIGQFPYERPWSISYPEPYKVTKKPVLQRFDVGSLRLNQSPYILEEPAYSDGDLIGNPYDTSIELSNEGGFGIQEFNGIHFPNQIAFVATKNYMYKYESQVAWNEKYANGFEPYWSPTDLGPYAGQPNLAGLSKVDGEKYQRVECGYGYFMKYQDWARVYRLPNGADVPLYNDYTNIGVASPGIYDSYKSVSSYRRNVNNIDDQSMAFAFENFLNNKINTGGIFMYRIVESGLSNIKIPQNFVIPTYWELYFEGWYNRLYSFQLTNKGVIAVTIINSMNGAVKLASTGAFYGPGQTIIVQPNDIVYMPNSLDETSGGDVNSLVAGNFFKLPGNAGYDSSTNKYTTAAYHLRPCVSGSFANNNNFHNDGVSLNFDNDVIKPANSSGIVKSKFQSQSDVSSYGNGGFDDGIHDVGNSGNTDDLLDVVLIDF